MAKKMPPKSLYGSYWCTKHYIACNTVGELKKLLENVPDDLPLGRPNLPVWFNVGCNLPGLSGEHLGFEEPEDWIPEETDDED